MGLPLLFLFGGRYCEADAGTSGSAAKCTPTNWDHSWFKAGNVWYTETQRKGSWQQMMMSCQQIESGRSSIATIRSKNERRQIEKSSLSKTKRWIGGVRIAQSLWYWFHYTGQDASIIPIEKFFWEKGGPSSPTAAQVCTKLQENKKCWKDAVCHTVSPA